MDKAVAQRIFRALCNAASGWYNRTQCCCCWCFIWWKIGRAGQQECRDPHAFPTRRSSDLEWIKPLHNESLEHYAMRLRDGITEPNAVVVGVSFGGRSEERVSRNAEIHTRSPHDALPILNG